MNILILNFAVAGYAGDTKQPLLIAKGLMNLGHHVVYATPDGDGYFFDEQKSKSYAQIRKKLVDAKGEIIEIEGVPILPIHCTSEKLGYYFPDAKMIAKKILPDFDVVIVYIGIIILECLFSKLQINLECHLSLLQWLHLKNPHII